MAPATVEIHVDGGRSNLSGRHSVGALSGSDVAGLRAFDDGSAAPPLCRKGVRSKSQEAKDLNCRGFAGRRE